MRTRIEFTHEGLQKAKSHVTSQLKKLGNVDLEAIQEACQGKRTRNASMLINLSGCGVSDVLQLWEHTSGRQVVVTSIEEILKERRSGRLTQRIWDNVHKLA